MTRFATDIRPMSDLKSGGADIVRQAQETGRPVALTRHGRAVAVVLSAAAYDQLAAKRQGYPWAPESLEALRAAIAEADADVAAGRVTSHVDFMEELRQQMTRDGA